MRDFLVWSYFRFCPPPARGVDVLCQTTGMYSVVQVTRCLVFCSVIVLRLRDQSYTLQVVWSVSCCCSVHVTDQSGKQATDTYNCCRTVSGITNYIGLSKSYKLQVWLITDIWRCTEGRRRGGDWGRGNRKCRLTRVNHIHLLAVWPSYFRLVMVQGTQPMAV